ncbi:MAG: FAD/NAD(P)-binding protein [Proteobacteria bacterium]|nr:FAD/NAD(P)-binding protein [Desulfobacteraceae bacterium]MBU1902250.1 FAD/NAD(P)-binding protein [Pseudomonadota bacterium]
MNQPILEASPFLPRWAEITRIEKLTESEKLFEMHLVSGEPLGHLPGQFVELSVMGIGEAPISISSAPRENGAFELAIRKVGNLTTAIHNAGIGDKVGIRGPFGTHFPVEETKGKDLLFVAGGIGLVPLRSFIHFVLDHRNEYGKVIIFFGARNPSERLFLDELDQWSTREDIKYFDTVDRGDANWTGNVGVITTLFPKIHIDPSRTYCAVVGPPVMYRFVILEAKAKGIPDRQIFLSLERRMKCGIGKCGHCQINHIYVCQDGPVFKYSDIFDLEEAL